ncbi:hypothetical protein H0H93_000374, partial [Arthromyces matolae]
LSAVLTSRFMISLHMVNDLGLYSDVDPDNRLHWDLTTHDEMQGECVMPPDDEESFSNGQDYFMRSIVELDSIFTVDFERGSDQPCS